MSMFSFFFFFQNAGNQSRTTFTVFFLLFRRVLTFQESMKRSLMFDVFIVLVQFWMNNHLHLMKAIKASKQFLGHIFYTQSPSEGSSAVLERSALLCKEDTICTMTHSYCSKRPSTLHHPKMQSSSQKPPATSFTCSCHYPFNTKGFKICWWCLLKNLHMNSLQWSLLVKHNAHILHQNSIAYIDERFSTCQNIYRYIYS